MPRAKRLSRPTRVKQKHVYRGNVQPCHEGMFLLLSTYLHNLTSQMALITVTDLVGTRNIIFRCDLIAIMHGFYPMQDS